MKTNKAEKLLANTLLLVFVMAIVILPAVSSGIMKINKDDRVLSVTDERLDVPTKPRTKTTNTKIRTIIIQEIPERQPTIDFTETTETTESTATNR
jgi:hypothetical protein